MKYFIYIWLADNKVDYKAVADVEELLQLVVKLTRENTKFAVQEIGDCIGDFSIQEGKWVNTKRIFYLRGGRDDDFHHLRFHL